MESTSSASATPIAALVIAPSSLAAAFATVPDPRRVASVRYPLAAILALAVTALLANHRSVLAIAEWGARQERSLVRTLGFPSARTPCQSTLHRLFRQVDGDALAAALTAHITPVAAVQHGERRAWHGVAIDGKAQRGRLRFGGGGCPIHALSAVCHASGLVLAHEPITRDGDKAEAELSVAPALVARLDWRERVLTGDALFCQRNLCRQVGEAGGAYLLVVKENQPTLHDAIALLFDPPPDLHALPLLDRRAVVTVERGHGRRDDRRHLVASTDLTGYLEWPGIAQVFRLERTWREHGTTHRARHYGITSLTPAQADPARLLALRRGHWVIENALHRQKDVAFGEDASLVHLGQGPTVLALLRDAALNCLHHAGIRQIAARLRLHAQYPEQAAALVPAASTSDFTVGDCYTFRLSANQPALVAQWIERLASNQKVGGSIPSEGTDESIVPDRVALPGGSLRAQILSIGSELILGHLTDTNATYLAQQLAGLGIELVLVTQVGDDLVRLTSVIRDACDGADVVICTGGVGPTVDDLTREAIAAVAGETPEVDPDLLETVRGLLSSPGHRDARTKQQTGVAHPIRGIVTQPGRNRARLVR